MAGVNDLDRRAVLDGAAVAAMIAVPVQVVARLVLDEDKTSGWTALLFLLTIGALVLGSGAAAWRQDRRTPLTPGLVTGAGTFIAIQAVLTAIKLALGDSVAWGRIFVGLTLSLVAGILGGLLGA